MQTLFQLADTPAEKIRSLDAVAGFGYRHCTHGHSPFLYFSIYHSTAVFRGYVVHSLRIRLVETAYLRYLGAVYESTEYEGKSTGMTQPQSRTEPADNKADALPPVEGLSFEAALEELEGIVRRLETGQIALEESIAAYERGVALKRHCEARLNDARMKIEKISLAADGSPQAAVPLDDGTP